MTRSRVVVGAAVGAFGAGLSLTMIGGMTRIYENGVVFCTVAVVLQIVSFMVVLVQHQRLVRAKERGTPPP